MNIKSLLLLMVTSFCIMTCTVVVNAEMNSFDNPINEITNAQAYILKGLELYKSGNYEEAIKFYDRAIVLEPETETAEAGWAGKELAFYKQGKNDEALCCYIKLRDIDRKTNLIEKRKKELLDPVSGSIMTSSLWNDIVNKFSNNTIFIIGGTLIGSNIKKDTIVEGGALILEGGTYVFRREVVSGAGALIAPEIAVPAMIILAGYDAYTHRDEIKNAIDSVFSKTNSTNNG